MSSKKKLTPAQSQAIMRKTKGLILTNNNKRTLRNLGNANFASFVHPNEQPAAPSFTHGNTPPALTLSSSSAPPAPSMFSFKPAVTSFAYGNIPPAPTLSSSSAPPAPSLFSFKPAIPTFSSSNASPAPTLSSSSAPPALSFTAFPQSVQNTIANKTHRITKRNIHTYAPMIESAVQNPSSVITIPLSSATLESSNGAYEMENMDPSEIMKAVPKQITWQPFPDADTVYQAIENAHTNNVLRQKDLIIGFYKHASAREDLLSSSNKNVEDVLQRMGGQLQLGQAFRFKIKPKEFFENFFVHNNNYPEKKVYKKNFRYFPPGFPWLHDKLMNEANKDEQERNKNNKLHFTINKTVGVYNDSSKRFMNLASILFSYQYINLPPHTKYKLSRIDVDRLNDLVLYDTFEVEGVLSDIIIVKMKDAFISSVLNKKERNKNLTPHMGTLYMVFAVLKKASIIITFEGNVYRTFVDDVKVPFRFIDEFTSWNEEDLATRLPLNIVQRTDIPATIRSGLGFGGTRRIRRKAMKHSRRYRKK